MAITVRKSNHAAAAEIEYNPDFSIIVPCFNEENSIQEFHERLLNTLGLTDYCFERIYVNDGSKDETLNCLLEIYKNDKVPAIVVDLVQNVGQTNAMTSGLQYANGKHLIFLDGDLQVAPEDLILLLDRFDDSFDMICGARIQRKDNRIRVYLSRLGNTIIRKILGLPIHDFGSGMRIVNGAFARAFESGPFRPINPGAMMLSLQRMAEVPIEHHARRYGSSRWSMRRFLALYHNIFQNLIPFIYLFFVIPMFALSLLLFVYFFIALLYPQIFLYAKQPALIPMLAMFSIVLGFVNFLLLGEFMLRGNGQVQKPSYIVRRIYQVQHHTGE